MVSTPTLDLPALATAEPLLALRVRVRRGELDRALAGGASPAASPELALRARQLGDAREALDAARRLDAILSESERPVPGLTARAPLQRAQIAAAMPFLASLVQRLGDVAAPRPEGVARALVLLTDGAGPLYAPAHPGTLASRAWRAADAL